MAEEQTNDAASSPNQPSTIHELRPKMKLTGRVTRTDLYGAFVDIGIGRDALVHISKIQKGAVNRVEDVLSVGDEVTVYVDRVDKSTGRVSLTMIKPLDVTWRELERGQVFDGTVTRVEQYGIFVDIGAERPGLVHVSEMGEGYVSHPNDLYKVDDSVTVRVLDYDRKKRRIDLAVAREEIAPPNPTSEEAEEAPPPTAMEYALREAFKEADEEFPLDRRGKRGRRERSRSSKRRQQDDLLERTLRSRKS
jgi:small subunit ribosomal protein S1